jgi:hypothetical protein
VDVYIYYFVYFLVAPDTLTSTARARPRN